MPPPSALQRAVDDWLGHLEVERGASPNTLSSYRRDLGRYTAYLHGRGVTEPTAVTEAHVTDFLAHLREGDADHAPLAASSAARTLVAVRGFHRFLALEGDVPAVDDRGFGGFAQRGQLIRQLLCGRRPSNVRHVRKSV